MAIFLSLHLAVCKVVDGESRSEASGWRGAREPASEKGVGGTERSAGKDGARRERRTREKCDRCRGSPTAQKK